ncbi:MFS transporter [Enterococcus sp. AZ109]|uniref:MFS transporter n=1 Tax=Enterococcus sp. AZ109 TaxID=2774634 RepID=UPI003F260029
MNKKRINYAWIVFIGCCVLSFVGFGLVINTPGLYFTSISEELGFSRTEIAMTLTLQALACAGTLLFAGKIIAKVNIKLLMSLCVLIFGGGFMVSSLFTSIIPFYIVWILVGIAQAFALVVAVPVLIGNWFEKKLGLAMGISMGITGLGGAFFNPFISNIIVTQGWRTAYLIAGIIVLVTILPFTLFIFKFKPDPKKGEMPYGRELNEVDEITEEAAELTGMEAKEAYRTPSFFLYVITIILLNLIAGFVQHVSSHVVSMGFILTVGASVVSGIMVGAAVGKIMMGILLDILNAKIVIIVYALLGMFGWAGLILSQASIVLIACGFLLGLGQAILLVALPYFIRKTFGSKDYGQIFSIISMFGSFSSAASASLGGYLFDRLGSYNISIGGNVLFYAVATVCILSAYLLKMKKKSNDSLNQRETVANK